MNNRNVSIEATGLTHPYIPLAVAVLVAVEVIKASFAALRDGSASCLVCCGGR